MNNGLVINNCATLCLIIHCSGCIEVTIINVTVHKNGCPHKSKYFY